MQLFRKIKDIVDFRDRVTCFFLLVIEKSQILLFSIEMQSANGTTVVVIRQNTKVCNGVASSHALNWYYTAHNSPNNMKAFQFFLCCHDTTVFRFGKRFRSFLLFFRCVATFRNRLSHFLTFLSNCSLQSSRKNIIYIGIQRTLNKSSKLLLHLRRERTSNDPFTEEFHELSRRRLKFFGQFHLQFTHVFQLIGSTHYTTSKYDLWNFLSSSI